MTENKITRGRFLQMALATGTGFASGFALRGTESPPQTTMKEGTWYLSKIEDLPAIATYEPAFNQQRPLVEFPRETLSVHEVSDLDEYLDKGLQQDLQKLLGHLEQFASDPIVNPDISVFRWMRMAPNESYFSPANLIQLFRIFVSDSEKKWIEIHAVGDINIPRALAATHTDFVEGPNGSSLGKTTILLNGDQIREQKYASLKNGTESTGITNLNLIMVLFYEYANRLNTIGSLVYLKTLLSEDQKTAFPGSIRSLAGILADEKTIRAAEVEKHTQELSVQEFASGIRLSSEQNTLVLWLQRAFAASLGDESAKIIGLERNETVSPLYIYFIAALHGDVRAMHELQRCLIEQGLY